MCKKKIITFPLNRNVLSGSSGTSTALGVSGQAPPPTAGASVPKNIWIPPVAAGRDVHSPTHPSHCPQQRATDVAVIWPWIVAGALLSLLPGAAKALRWKIYSVLDRVILHETRTVTSWVVSSSFPSWNPSWFITLCPSRCCNEIKMFMLIYKDSNIDFSFLQ